MLPMRRLAAKDDTVKVDVKMPRSMRDVAKKTAKAYKMSFSAWVRELITVRLAAGRWRGGPPRKEKR